MNDNDTGVQRLLFMIAAIIGRQKRATEETIEKFFFYKNAQSNGD